MTSVAIISGAVARIENLKEQVKQSENLQNGVNKLLQGLRSIKERLMAAYEDKREKPAAKFAGLEKEVVRLSYDIVERLTSMLRRGKVELQDLNEKLDHLQQNLENENGAAGADQIPESSTASLDLEENQSRESTAALLARLRTELQKDYSSASSPVVCILGDSGMGKTTLARKLFHDHQLQSGPFQVFAWVSINQNFQIKRVLVNLLQQLGPRKKSDIREMNEIQLIAQIFAALEEKKFLIVLDDIWGVEVWQNVRLALPVSKSSRVIITTSSMEVAQVAAKDSIFRIPGLIQSDILTILKETANLNPDSDVAKAISDISGGSPHIATILGKALSTAAAASEQELVQELLSYKPQKGTPQVLGACYKRLSPELKPYLLYLGQFPLGQDIEVEKLYTLLAAEDLIMPTDKSENSLQFRKDILEKLARMELVEVQEDIVSKHGIYKSCRLHDQVREFCKLKGSDEEFVEIVDFKNTKEVGPNTRRLAIYMNKYKDGKSNIPFTSHDTVKKIGSLLIFDAFESEQNPRWPSEINDLKEFHSLIVLNFGGVDFRVRKYPKGIDRVRLLRYLSFQGCWLEELPPSLSKLTNLETLDLLIHPDCQMFIPSSILANMKGLVHLYLPRLYVSDGKPKSQLLGSERLEAFYTYVKEMVNLHFPRLLVGDGKAKLQLQGLERLETLVNFDTGVCDVAGLSQLRKLKILVVTSSGQWEELCAVLEYFVAEKESSLQQLSVDIRNFDRYNSDGVFRFKKLLSCPLLHSLRAKGQIGELAVEGDPSPNIAEIVLSGSELEHDSMNVLGKFQNLRRLVLTNDAFVRSEIVISSSTSEFPNLRSLKLQNLQYLEKLTIEEGALPELSSLEIDRCRRLAELSIPKELHDRLVKARGENGGAFSVMPLPAEFHITPSDSDHHQVPSSSYTK